MLAKPLLVLSSYSLLFALLAIRVDYVWLKWTCGGLAFLGVLSLLAVVGSALRTTRETVEIDTIRGPGAEASAYLSAYLLPFVVSPTPTPWDLLAYAVFLIVAGVVTTRTGVVQINPLVYLVGYRVLEVTPSRGEPMLILIRGNKRKGDKITVHRLPSDVGIAR